MAFWTGCFLASLTINVILVEALYSPSWHVVVYRASFALNVRQERREDIVAFCGGVPWSFHSLEEIEAIIYVSEVVSVRVGQDEMHQRVFGGAGSFHLRACSCNRIFP